MLSNFNKLLFQISINFASKYYPIRQLLTHSVIRIQKLKMVLDCGKAKVTNQRFYPTLKVTLVAVVLILLNEVDAIQTIELNLSAGEDGRLTTIISIGGIQQEMEADINEQLVHICCKSQNSIFQKIFYFLDNPFFQIRDYSCKPTDQNHTLTDTALIPYLKQEQFPQCTKGKLGLTINSYFLSLLPTHLRSFTIFQNPTQYRQYTLKFGQDTAGVKEYSYFPTLKNQNWALQSTNLKFNQILLGSYTIQFNSNSNFILLPSKLYEFVSHELINSFDCKEIKSSLYCPCQTGFPTSYPSLLFSLQNLVTLEIKPQTYMIQDAEVCKVQVKKSVKPQVEANILYFSDFVFKFDPVNQRMGVLKNLNDQFINEKIKLPLQLILNCLVILLLCIFLALVLIEIIKRVSGLAEVREQIFRVDERDKNYQHFAYD